MYSCGVWLCGSRHPSQRKRPPTFADRNLFADTYNRCPSQIPFCVSHSGEGWPRPRGGLSLGSAPQLSPSPFPTLSVQISNQQQCARWPSSGVRKTPMLTKPGAYLMDSLGLDRFPPRLQSSTKAMCPGQDSHYGNKEQPLTSVVEFSWRTNSIPQHLFIWKLPSEFKHTWYISVPSFASTRLA